MAGADGYKLQLKHSTNKVLWRELDFIMVDIPPGTGDTINFFTRNDLDGDNSSTHQELALQDVKRGIKMFDKLGVKIIGLVDNMSYFYLRIKKYPILVKEVLKKLLKNLAKNSMVKYL